MTSNNLLQNIQIILVETSHPGNIGATARAMKTMGLTHLTLVKPKIFPHAEATARAAGADDILKNAKIIDNLDDAIAETQVVFGTSARLRSHATQLISPEQAAKTITNLATKYQVALLFGRENNGLTNEELQLCNYHIHIPTNQQFSSLNLASAVQILAYEISKHALHSIPTNIPKELANAKEIQLFHAHLEKTLHTIKFLDQNNPRKLMQRLHLLTQRAQLAKDEVSILRGILTAIEQMVTQNTR